MGQHAGFGVDVEGEGGRGSMALGPGRAASERVRCVRVVTAALRRSVERCTVVSVVAVGPRPEHRVEPRRRETADEPGQVQSAEGAGSEALHHADRAVHEHPRGDDADDEAHHGGPVDVGQSPAPIGSNSRWRIQVPLLDDEVVHQHDARPTGDPGDDRAEPGAQHRGQAGLEDEEDDGRQCEHADEQVQRAPAQA